MFKGFTAISAALFSGMLFAGTTPMTTCPNLDSIMDPNSTAYAVYPIVPGSLYTSMKFAGSDDQKWVVFIGPVKAKTGDAVSDVAEYILARTAVEGKLENTEEGTICSYHSGYKGVFVTAVEANDSDDQNALSNLVNKLRN